MISIKIMGGFGNQLFQVFAAIAYGIQHNVKIVLPYNSNMGHRHTYWDTFLSDFVIFTTKNPENQFSEDDIGRLSIYQERNFTFEPFPDFGNNGICLLGYFQSFKYFESVQNTIYNILRLPEKKQRILSEYGDYFSIKSPNELVSIHFRMGDYKEKRYYHPIMNYEYFEESLAYIISLRPGVKRVLYMCESEDNEYVFGKIRLLNARWPDLEFMKIDDKIPDYDQVIIMAQCDHNIISNSSFSWWGAYMNSNPGKIVCYPSKWFGEYYEHTHDHRDMMPESWSKIKSDPIPWDQPLL